MTERPDWSVPVAILWLPEGAIVKFPDAQRFTTNGMTLLVRMHVSFSMSRASYTIKVLMYAMVNQMYCADAGEARLWLSQKLHENMAMRQSHAVEETDESPPSSGLCAGD